MEGIILSSCLFLGRILQQLEDDVSRSEARMEKWKTNLAVMDAKQQQYLQQHANFKVYSFVMGTFDKFALIISSFYHGKDYKETTHSIYFPR